MAETLEDVAEDAQGGQGCRSPSPEEERGGRPICRKNGKRNVRRGGAWKRWRQLKEKARNGDEPCHSSKGLSGGVGWGTKKFLINLHLG